MSAAGEQVREWLAIATPEGHEALEGLEDALAALARLEAVADAAEAILRHRDILGEFPQLEAALRALDEGQQQVPSRILGVDLDGERA